MAVPTSISELSTTPGSNSPVGADAPSVLDDHIRTVYAFIRTLSDEKAAIANAVLLTGSQTVAGIKTFSSTPVVPDDSFALAKLANIATARILGRVTASSGDIEELTAAQVRTLAGLVIGTDVLAPDGSGAALTNMGRRLGQIQQSYSGTVATGVTAIPWDNSVPQNTEGDSYYSVSITPQNASSLLEIDVVMNLTSSATGQVTASLFKDAEASARAAASSNTVAGAGQPTQVVLKYFVSAGSTVAQLFTVRAGGTSGTTTVNGSGGAGRFAGACISGISVKEYLP